MSNLYPFKPQASNKLSVPDDEAIYRVIGKGFFDGETLHGEYDDNGRPVLVAFPDEPNYNLLPMNELAMQAVEKWKEKLELGAMEARESKDSEVRRAVGAHDIQMRAYLARIADTGRFSAERIQVPIMSTGVVKSRARVIEQPEISTPDIRTVAKKRNDQKEIVNG